VSESHCPKNSHRRRAWIIYAAFVALGMSACDKDAGASFSPVLKKLPLEPKAVKITQTPPAAKNLMLIVVDTLRADRLGCYGYKRNTTPRLNSIAAEGIVFERFYAASPWTAPSFGTIFTGVSPAIHRTGKWLKKKEADTKQIGRVVLHPLNPRIPTIGELFDDFSTAGILTNAFLKPKLGFSRGFDYFDQVDGLAVGTRRAKKVTDKAIKQLSNIGDKPFMFVVHYFDPHTAYDPLPQDKKRFLDVPPPSDYVKAPFGPRSREQKKAGDVSAEEKAYIIGLYDAEVFHVDEHIGRLVDYMKKKGLLENTWLVITSDHGEEHYDHGGFNHGHQYEDEVVRVPLIIRAPGGDWGAGTRVQTAARHVDLVPTFLDWFEKKPPPFLEGKSLMPILKGEETRHREAYMEYPLSTRETYAYFDGRYKIIKNIPQKKTYAYDLHLDPGEKKKIKGRRKLLKRLEKKIEKYHEKRNLLKARTAASAEDSGYAFSNDTQEALKNLGYLE
jgi:arylsulfatase A-like enzyme